MEPRASCMLGNTTTELHPLTLDSGLTPYCVISNKSRCSPGTCFSQIWRPSIEYFKHVCSHWTPVLFLSLVSTMNTWDQVFFLFFGFGGTGVWTWGFSLAKQVLYHLSYTSSSFGCGYFGDKVLRTICLGWLQASILWMSAFQIARITGVSQHLV
jgi:hypothetical protein